MSRRTGWTVCLRVCALHQLKSLADPQASELFDQLSGLVVAAYQFGPETKSLGDRAVLQRVAFALERRLAIWRGVHELSRPVLTPVSLRNNAFDAAKMTECVKGIDQQLTQLDNAQTWRQYLLLDHLRQLESQQWSACAAERSRLARAILTRLSAANETPDERQFFSAPAWQAFSDELRTWVVEPVDYQQLLDDLERLEETGGEGAAGAVADYYQLMRWSTSPLVAELGERINTHYRNANVRVAISADLVNRLLPHPQTVDEAVNDTLMGGRVFGRSRVSTRLNVVLFPDRQQWKMGLEAEGNVDSHTETKRGPAVFHNAGRARYLARKLLLMDHRGLRAEEAEAAAISNANLTRLETDLDGVPVVNLLVRAIARQQYDSKAGEAKWEAEGLLADRRSRVSTRKLTSNLPRRPRGSAAQSWNRCRSWACARNGRPRDDRGALDCALSPRGLQPGRSFHTAAAGVGRQPAERADPRNGAQQCRLQPAAQRQRNRSAQPVPRNRTEVPPRRLSGAGGCARRRQVAVGRAGPDPSDLRG